MYGIKFTLFYVIAAMAALASASPVPVAAADVRIAAADILAREPLPATEDVVAREPGCMAHGNGCI